MVGAHGRHMGAGTCLHDNMGVWGCFIGDTYSYAQMQHVGTARGQASLLQARDSFIDCP